MKIDREYLLSLSPQPCESGLAAFDAAFPDGLLVEGDLDDATLDKLRGLDLGWFAATLPTEAQADYKRAMAEAWDDYKRTMAEAWDDYKRTMAEAWAAYDLAVVEAQAAFRRAVARALWRIIADTEES